MLLPPSSWKLTVPICALPEPLMVVFCSGPPRELPVLLLLTPPVRFKQGVQVAVDQGKVHDLVLPDRA